MKTTTAKISFASLLVIAFTTFQTLAEPPQSDPLGAQFFPPEMLLQARQEIGLTDAQQNWLRQKVEDVSARAPELQRRLRSEVEALAEIAKADHVDEAKLLAQLDKVLDAERAMKHLHLTTLASIKNQLTTEQQARLRTLRNQHAEPGGEGSPQHAELRARLEGKIKRIQAAVQQWQESGRDPSAVAEIMQGFEPLMKQGKPGEAEAVLDHAMSEIGIGEAPKAGAENSHSPRRAGK